jgi:hypothetical protein
MALPFFMLIPWVCGEQKPAQSWNEGEYTISNLFVNIVTLSKKEYYTG